MEDLKIRVYKVIKNSGIFISKNNYSYIIKPNTMVDNFSGVYIQNLNTRAHHILNNFEFITIFAEESQILKIKLTSLINYE